MFDRIDFQRIATAAAGMLLLATVAMIGTAAPAGAARGDGLTAVFIAK